MSERLCEPQASAAPRAVLKKRADDAATVAFVASLVLAIVVAVMVPAFLE